MDQLVSVVPRVKLTLGTIHWTLILEWVLYTLSLENDLWCQFQSQEKIQMFLIYFEVSQTIYPFIHWFSKYLLSRYFVPGGYRHRYRSRLPFGYMGLQISNFLYNHLSHKYQHGSSTWQHNFMPCLERNTMLASERYFSPDYLPEILNQSLAMWP